MKKEEVIEKTKKYVEGILGEGESSHDKWHVYRVWRNAIRIGRAEKVDMFIVEMAALLHDISDWKLHNGNENVGPDMARKWLESQRVNKSVTDHVCSIIKDMSFKGTGNEKKMETREGMVVQDADRLDATGAIGIARAFAYGGHIGRPLYDPAIKPKIHNNFKSYNEAPTINHFHEKLLKIRNLMNTEAGKRMAAERHKYMEEFLERFASEWEGRA